ncbi:hypothetical protein GCM10008986_25300 [Salinibacillus aidingensis]|uniref:Membrane protein YesL n=1 Tax=Salinibacillus aidingensis TaxID=237684 RepID=A0ABN1BHM2_9BACI
MIKESLALYNRQLMKILMLSVILVIPLTLLCYFATFYFYQQLTNQQYPNLYALFLIVVNFTLIIPVFNRLAISDIEDEEDLSVWKLLYEFIRHFGTILFLTVPLYILGVLGSFLLYIPTILCFSLILLIPFYVSHSKVNDMIRHAGRTMRDEHLLLLMDWLVILSVQVLVWGLIMLTFENFENNVYVYGIARAIINSFVFPLLIFYLTFRYSHAEERL